MNGAALDEQKEMGQDGKVTNLSTTPYYTAYTDIHKWMGRDAFGYAIGYFGDGSNANLRDYESITAGISSGNRWLCDIPQTFGDNLYNGNIRHVVLGLRDQTEDTIRNRATAYKHDQLQRLKETYNYFNWDNSYASILSSTRTGLREKVWYDANGNITELNRYDDAGMPALMDEFSYNYYGNVNRLGHVDDAVSTGGISTDKEDQDPNNYSYDEIGQLRADVKEGINNINWNVRNKPLLIEKTGDVKILFEYDELGHRVKKEVREGNENEWTQQWYVLDPQGNPVAVYEHKYTNPSTNTYNEYLDLKEHQIYGGDRLGTRNYENYHLWGQTFTSTSFTVDGEFNSPSGHSPLGFLLSSYELHKRKTGMKTYEIKGHTNNVQAVVTDYKVPFVTGCSGVSDVEYYLPDVVSYTDYFVFGGVMNNRNTSSNEYRYGFQGQERDNEIKGNDNSVNYEYRMHDPQYGRFLSIDPLAAEYPHNSPYAFSENRLIDAVELEGLEQLQIASPGYYMWKATGYSPRANEQETKIYLSNLIRQAYNANKETLKWAGLTLGFTYGALAVTSAIPAAAGYFGWSFLSGATTRAVGFIPTINYATTQSLWRSMISKVGFGAGTSAGFWQTSTSFWQAKLAAVGIDYTIQYGYTGKVDVTAGFKYFNPGYGIIMDIGIDVNVGGKEGFGVETVLTKPSKQIFLDAISAGVGVGSGKFIEKAILHDVKEGLKKEFMKGLTDQTVNFYTGAASLIIKSGENPINKNE